MRISDWSSDVCSSDLYQHEENEGLLLMRNFRGICLINAFSLTLRNTSQLLMCKRRRCRSDWMALKTMIQAMKKRRTKRKNKKTAEKIGRAPGRARVCK